MRETTNTITIGIYSVLFLQKRANSTTIKGLLTKSGYIITIKKIKIGSCTQTTVVRYMLGLFFADGKQSSYDDNIFIKKINHFNICYYWC